MLSVGHGCHGWEFAEESLAKFQEKITLERHRVQELKDAMVSHRTVGKDLTTSLAQQDAETSRLEAADACHDWCKMYKAYKGVRNNEKHESRFQQDCKPSAN